MEIYQERPCLRQLILKDIKIRFNAFKAAVVDLRSFVVHRYQVLVVSADVFALVVVSTLKDQLF